MSTINTTQLDKIVVSGDAVDGWICHNILNTEDLAVVNESNPLPVAIPTNDTLPETEDQLAQSKNILIAGKTYSEGAGGQTGSIYLTAEALLGFRTPLHVINVDTSGAITNPASGRLFSCEQITLTTAQLICPDGLGTARKSVVVQVLSGDDIWCNGSGSVSNANGFKIVSGTSASFDTTGAIYGKSDGTSTISVLVI